jgi:hypothetical protein
MIHIIGGGTFSHVRSHLALAAPAFGQTARGIHAMYAGTKKWTDARNQKMFALTNDATLHLTKMADHTSDIVTNDDVGALIDRLVADPTTRVIYMNAALCDFDGSILEWRAGEDFETPSGKYAERLKTSNGNTTMLLTPADKIISRIRKTRKDIFLVAFKTTTGATPDEQYAAGLNLLKANSCNLVLANDTVTRLNMVVTPEESRYHETTDRYAAIRGLVEMTKARSTNTFTRSTVLPGTPVDFQHDDRIPDNIRTVVNHLVERGAYKPFRGATVGHFAVKIDEGRCLTSRRKTDYTKPGGLDLVEVEYDGNDKVIAYGAKPSVGGQSQRIVFAEHPDLDCIVHAHVPLRDHPREPIPVASQAEFECGSHQCGANTSRNLEGYDDLQAVMLDNHGPNIVFSRDTPAQRVIDFIEANFDLEAKTGGLIPA